MYRDHHALITGGLGFLGSNLAIRLIREGARVTIVDPSVVGCGANLHNIAGIRDSVELIELDISQAHVFRERLATASIIFNLAGEISHIHSMARPERDLAINTLAQLRFLQECRTACCGVRVVYAGTRQIYGAPEYLPIDEEHPIRPIDFNGIHKYAACMYHQMLTRGGDLDAVVLRFTNVYGPRMALDTPCQGFLSTFIRRMVFGDDIEVFGNGEQLRDPMYIDDAVEALMRAGAAVRLSERSYNVGGPEAISVKRIAEIATTLAGTGVVRLRAFPPERKAIDIGSYYTDTRLLERDFGFRPGIRIEDGLRRTLAYYNEHFSNYLDPANRNPVCKLEAPAEMAAVSST